MKDYIQQPRAISRLIRHKSHREDLPSVQEILSSTKEGKISTSPPIQCLNSQFGGPPPDLSGNTGTSNTACLLPELLTILINIQNIIMPERVVY